MTNYDADALDLAIDFDFVAEMLRQMDEEMLRKFAEDDEDEALFY